jgi:hypothetical protein
MAIQPVVQLSEEQCEECKKLVEDLRSYYRGNGDRLTAMPWTRDLVSNDELRQWLASRKDAAAKVDVKTCEIGSWYINDFDPYGIEQALGELPPELKGYGGRGWFVRSPDTNGWVSERDLPPEKLRALDDRN